MTKERGGRQLGFWMALALVMGNVIGAGVFLLPQSLAPLGPSAIYGWGLTIAGAMCIAWLMAQLARRIQGGPYAYVRAASGDLPAFMVMWAYWISIWVGIPAIAIAAVSYLSSIVPALGQPIVAPASAAAVVWILTFVNMRGARTAGWVQLVTVTLKILPLVAVAIVAAAVLGGGHGSAAMDAVPVSTAAIATAAALSLFAMLGFESATVPAGKIRDPERTVPLATIAGTAAVGIIYLTAFASILFLLPTQVIANSPAPFADAIVPALGAAAGTAVALFATISALGAVNGWVLLSGEVPLTLAREGIFPRWFAVTSGPDTPVRAQLLSSLFATLLIASNYSRSMAGLFTFLLLITTVAALFLYLACTLATLRLTLRGQLAGTALVLAAVAGFAFSVFAFWGAGGEATLWGTALLATGIPVYFLMRRARRSTQPAAADDPAAPPEPAA
jgi:basic amino acid/polyamine antiporter, APA family